MPASGSPTSIGSGRGPCGFLAGISLQVDRLPFFPKAETLSVGQTLGTQSIHDQLPFAGFHFRVGGYGAPFGFPEVFSIEVAILLLLYECSRPAH